MESGELGLNNLLPEVLFFKIQLNMKNTQPIKHISREELYTNLEARIAYLHDFLDFGSSKLKISFEIKASPAQVN